MKTLKAFVFNQKSLSTTSFQQFGLNYTFWLTLNWYLCFPLESLQKVVLPLVKYNPSFRKWTKKFHVKGHQPKRPQKRPVSRGLQPTAKGKILFKKAFNKLINWTTTNAGCVKPTGAKNEKIMNENHQPQPSSRLRGLDFQVPWKTYKLKRWNAAKWRWWWWWWCYETFFPVLNWQQSALWGSGRSSGWWRGGVVG